MPNEREIRPFHAEFPEAELTELRRRINATRWPERETVTDDSQGVRLVMMQREAPAGAPGRGIELQEGQRYDSVLAHARRAARGLGPAAR
jgi:hypothetical protein